MKVCISRNVLAVYVLFLAALLYAGEAKGSGAIEEQEYFIIAKPTQLIVMNDAHEEIERMDLKKGEVFKADRIAGTRVYFEAGERFGYTGTQYIAPLPSWSESKTHLYFQPLEDVPAYKKVNGVLQEAAKLKKGEVYKRERDYGQWHMILLDHQPAFIPKENVTIPASESKFIKDTTIGVAAAGLAEVKQDTEIWYKKDGILLPFAAVKQGEKLNIYKEVGQWYIVQLAGKKGYISKNSTTLLSLDIVNPKVQNYTYEQMEKDLEELKDSYSSILTTYVIGKSVDGRNIYALKLGTGKEEVFLNASHHAREHMTSNLVMEMADTYADAYVHKKKVAGYYPRSILNHTSIWIVPMVNPDGVSLVQNGAKSAKNPAGVIKLNGGNTDFSAWKANIRGVDLNRQYPAEWDKIRFSPGKPGPQNYKGSKPLSEPEAAAVYRFTLNHRFKAAAAYHSSGQIIYWNFRQSGQRLARDLALAGKLRAQTGYSLVKPDPFSSGGGFTDWFIQSRKMPGFTPEIAPYTGNRPVPLKYFNQIWKENAPIGLLLASS